MKNTTNSLEQMGHEMLDLAKKISDVELYGTEAIPFDIRERELIRLARVPIIRELNSIILANFLNDTDVTDIVAELSKHLKV